MPAACSNKLIFPSPFRLAGRVDWHNVNISRLGYAGVGSDIPMLFVDEVPLLHLLD